MNRLRRLRYWWLRCRSWWYWRRFESPGSTADQQEAFARQNLSDGGSVGLW